MTADDATRWELPGDKVDAVRRELEERGDAVSRVRLLCALQGFATRRDNPLQPVQRVHTGARPFRAMCTVQDTAGQGLVALVDETGVVLAARCDALDKATRPLALEGFERRMHEVVSLVADGPRPGSGRNFDLWVIAREWAGDAHEVIAWHASLTSRLDGEAPLLRAVVDDDPTGAPERWRAVKADNLLPWLRTLRCTAAPDGRLFDRYAGAMIGKLPERGPRAPREMVALGASLGVRSDGHMKLTIRGVEGDVHERTLVRPFRTMAIAPTQKEGDAPFLAVMCDKGHLEVWHTGEGQARFVVTVAAQGTTLAWCPDEARVLPDLLLAHRNGQIERLRYVSDADHALCWKEAWEALELVGDDVARRLQRVGVLAAEAATFEQERACAEQALAVCALCEIERVPVGLSDGALGALLAPVVPLFESTRLHARNAPALRALSERIRTLARATHSEQAFHEARALARLLVKSYPPAPFAVQAQLDLDLHALELAHPRWASRDAELAIRVERARTSEDDLWSDRLRLRKETPDRYVLLAAERAHHPLVSHRVAAVPAELLGDRSKVFAFDDFHQLVIAGLSGLLLVDPKTRQHQVLRAPEAATPWPPEQIVALPGASPGLLLFWSDGRMATWRGLVGDAEVTTVQTGWAAPDGDLRAITVCPVGDRTLVVAAWAHSWRSTLRMFWLEAQTVSPLLAMPDTTVHGIAVEIMDAATTTDGRVYLAIAGGGDMCTRLYHIDPAGDGQLPQPEATREMGSRILALRFDRESAPDHLVGAEQSGHMWSFCLAVPPGIPRLKWIGGVEGTVKTLDALEIHGQTAVVAATEDGLMCAWETAGGRRLWRRRINHLVAGTSTGTPGYVVVLTQWGGLTTFRVLSTEEQKQAHEALLEVVGTPPDDPLYAQIKNPLGFALRALDNRADNLPALLHDLLPNERRRLLREWAANHPSHLRSHIREVVGTLAAPDAVVLVLSLRDGHPDIVRRVLEAFYARAKDAWDEQAIVACLSYLCRRCGPMTEEALFGLRPPEHLLSVPGRSSEVEAPDFPLLRLNFAHELQRVVIQAGALDLPRLILLLARLPPDVTITLAVVTGEWPEFELVRTLSKIISALLDGRRITFEALRRCIHDLETQREKSRSVGLFWHILVLSATRVNDVEFWVKFSRSRALSVVRGLYGLLSLPANDDPLAVMTSLRVLRPLFPDTQPPGEHATQRQRHAWWSAVLARLGTPIVEDRGSTWMPVMQGLHTLLEQRLRRMARIELEYIATMLRGTVRLLECRRLAYDIVEVKLRVTVDGERDIEHATIHVEPVEDGRKTGMDALSGKELGESRSYRVLKAGSPHEFDMKGRVRPGQRTFVVRVTISLTSGSTNGKATVSGGGSAPTIVRRTSEEWEFDLPEREKTDAARHVTRTTLPLCVEAMEALLMSSSARLQVVGVGEHLSASTLVGILGSRTDVRVIDLDEATAKYGARASLGPLSLAVLLQTVRPPEDSPALTRMLLASRLVSRFLEGEARDLLVPWMQHISNHAATEGPVIFVVGLEHAAWIGNTLPDERVVSIHTLPWQARLRVLGGEMSKPDEELLTWCERRWGQSRETVLSVVSACGYDLDLLLDFDRQLQPGRPVRDVVRDVLGSPTHIQRMRLQLRGLAGVALAWAVLGALHRVQIPVRAVSHGMIPAGDVKVFTERGTEPTLAKAGVRISHRQREEMLQALETKSIEVIGVWVSESVSSPTMPLLQRVVTTLTTAAERRSAFDELERLGVGCVTGDVLTTFAPFRRLIEEVARDFAGSTRRDITTHDRLADVSQPFASRVPLEALKRLTLEHASALFPNFSNERLVALRSLCVAWESGDAKTAPAALAALYEGEVLHTLPGDGLREDAALAVLAEGTRCVRGVGERSKHGLHAEYVLWYPKGVSPQAEAIRGAVEACVSTALERHQFDASLAATLRPRVIVVGPGVDHDDPQRRVPMLPAGAMVEVLRSSSPRAEALRYEARLRSRLMEFSPFQTEGPISPENPIFVGRKEELAFVQENIRKHSVLLVGGRRMGKTSLLFRLREWAKTQPDLYVIYLDLQGFDSEAGFLSVLQRVEPAAAGASSVDGALASIARHVGARRPVFFINEIDRILWSSPTLFERLRGWRDTVGATFVMTGYATALGATGEAHSSFFHMVKGPGTSRALTIGSLGDDAARDLCGLLETSALRLRWREQDREEGIQRVLRLSHGIPWFLQECCVRLVEAVEARGRTFLSLDDVEVLERAYRGKLWEYIQDVQFHRLLAPESLALIGGNTKGAQPARPGGGTVDQLHAGVLLVLTALARTLYFLPRPGSACALMDDPQLTDRRALDASTSFTLASARKIAIDTASQLVLPKEAQRLRAWIQGVDLRSILRALTLTPIVEVDREDSDRFAFFLHIFPMELQVRRQPDDATLDREFIERVSRFLEVFG